MNIINHQGNFTAPYMRHIWVSDDWDPDKWEKYQGNWVTHVPQQKHG